MSEETEDYEQIKNIARCILLSQRVVNSLSENFFRDNVISETKYLYTNSNFLSKIDDLNKHLVAFNNGVYAF